MKGGRYPIADSQDLANAVRAVGRTKPEKRAAVKSHIKKRAKALGREDMIPDSWGGGTAKKEPAAKAAPVPSGKGKHESVGSMAQKQATANKYGMTEAEMRKKIAASRRAMNKKLKAEMAAKFSKEIAHAKETVTTPKGGSYTSNPKRKRRAA